PPTETQAPAQTPKETTVVIPPTQTENASQSSAQDAAIQQAVAESQRAAAKKAAANRTTASNAQVRTARPQTVSMQPLQGPPTGLASSKEQRLNNLLEQYKSDNLTPEQYHAARAKILSEP